MLLFTMELVSLAEQAAVPRPGPQPQHLADGAVEQHACQDRGPCPCVGPDG